MRDYAILTDSCCDLPADLADELGLDIQPLSFTVNGKEYLNYPDNREMDPGTFYGRLRAGSLGSTSAVNVGTFHDRMAALADRGLDVLCIAFSSALSTTYQSACVAAGDVMAERKDCRIVVVDSRAASLGQGLLVYLAAQKKAEGASLDELAAFVEERRDHLCHWFTVDDLHHLKRGGRVSAAAAVMGTMLQMKPILHVDDLGRLIPVSRVRGRRASIRALADRMEELVQDPSAVFISHGDCREDADALAELVRARFPVKKLFVGYIGPVIGNHSGPGTLAIFFQGKHK